MFKSSEVLGNLLLNVSALNHIQRRGAKSPSAAPPSFFPEISTILGVSGQNFPTFSFNTSATLM